MEPNEIYHLVQARYGELAGRSSTVEQKGVEESVAKAFGYEASELSSIPQDANLGVSCGNPLALANVREVSSMRLRENNPILMHLLIITSGRNSNRLGQWRRH